jgi:S-methylmethionine-dependent homocysteine/selenocysteine methylase
MTQYTALEERISRGEVILLDGAVGTQLQEMGVPMNSLAWAAIALQTHPATVQLLHELYIKAGVDIITTNTYAAARHNLEPIGLGDLTGELNRRAVMLAREARDKASAGRPVLIAGSISNYGMTTGGEDYLRWRPRTRLTEEQLRNNLSEQAELLCEAGADFLLAESTGSNSHRKWVSDACRASGMPFWVGFKCRREPNETEVRTGYRSQDRLVDVLEDVMSHGGAVLSIFHSSVGDTTAALKTVLEKWSGPLGAYPDAERKDYIDPQRDRTVENKISPEEFVSHICCWVELGVQIVGGCCGYGLPYIRLLRDRLPSKVAKPRAPVATAA